jgi:hypothetical protein
MLLDGTTKPSIHPTNPNHYLEEQAEIVSEVLDSLNQGCSCEKEIYEKEEKRVQRNGED